MSRVNEFDGNDYISYVIDENEIDESEMQRILHFIHSHTNIFLYGDGMCGTGFKQYADICGFINIKGFVTSDTIQEFVQNYKKGQSGLILTLSADYYPEILPNILEKIAFSDVLFLKEKTKKKFILPFSQKYIAENFWLTLVVTKHCNINCASCSMFAPLCAPAYYSLENIKKDLQRIGEMNLPIKKINLTGGEPFLNPELIDILKYIRKLYPKLKIEVFTNGVLASEFKDEQLLALKESRAEFQITEYGLYTDKLHRVYDKFDAFGIDYVVNEKKDNKYFYKKRIDFDKKVPIYEYINCQFYSFCYDLYVFNGKMYKCPLALNLEDVNRHSDKKIIMTEKDFLEIDKISNPDELYLFWKSRLPLCSYCPKVSKSDVVQWKRSERKITEWT